MAIPLSSTDPHVRAAKAPFGQAVLICGKCVRRMGKPGRAVRKRLKRACKARRPERIVLIEARCFSLCPKRRVVVASAGTLARRRLLAAEPQAHGEALLEALLADLSP